MPVRSARRLVRGLRRATRAPGERLYGWWWWRSWNRPHIGDRTYIDLLASVPAGAYGLDLGSRSRVRPDAITVDVVEAGGVDVVADGHDLPFSDGTFDYVWCNAVLEHVQDPRTVAAEITRVLRPGAPAVVQVPFLEHVHGWPDDYFRFTPNGLRVIFPDLEEVAAGVSAGPSQVLPDLLQYYASWFGDLQRGRVGVNLWTIFVGAWLLPLRLLDRLLRNRPSYWKWARAYYYVGRKPELPGPARRRVAFVTPAASGGGFEEVMRLRTNEMARALARSGADVLPVPFDALGGETAGLERLRRFDPGLLVAPNLNYLLAASALSSGGPASPPVSRALLWDDPLGGLAHWLVQRRGCTLGELGPELPGDDVLQLFAAITRRDGVRHYAWDSGHMAAMAELDLVADGAVEWYPIVTFEPFLGRGRAPADHRFDVGFCGNVYPDSVERSNFSTDPFFAELTGRICDRTLADIGASAWTILRDEIAALADETRVGRGLVPERTPFWDYYLHVVWLALNTARRLDLLTKVARTVDVFGVFADPASVPLLARHPNLVYRGNAHQTRELPDVFAETKVNVCITNGLVYSGVPSKLIDCLASGGFALVDPKDDVRRLFGSDVEAIFFRDADELNAKIEYFLPRPDERREIVHALRQTIEAECTLERLCERLLAS